MHGYMYHVILSIKLFTKIVTFMTHWAVVLIKGRGQYDHIVKKHYILENRLLYSSMNLRKTKINVCAAHLRLTIKNISGFKRS